MSFINKLQSMLSGGGSDKEKPEDGDSKAAAKKGKDKNKGKEKPAAKSKQVKGSKNLDVEARFERMRSAVSGTMSNFIAARDRTYDRVVGLKL